jgi:hypothetical protein
MKTRKLQKLLAVLAIAGLTWSASVALAQDFSNAGTAQPAGVNSPVPQLSYGTAQIVRLAQANVGEDTIIAYIKNSGNSYGLNADQIIYLRQQGISDAIITTMLNQPKPAAAIAQPTTPAPQPVALPAVAPVPTTTIAPTVTYVQSVPATTYYYQPYYYPSYGWYSPVSLSFAWGGGWYGGHYYYGGWHGGGFGGWHGGGWHR